MEELKSCPFCGGDAKWINTVGTWGYVECTKCKSRTGERRDPVKAWNTRAERTCKDVETRADYWQCSECGVRLENPIECPTLWDGYIAISPRYCPNCGAKVVE